MKALSQDKIIDIISGGKIGDCSKVERDQVMRFAFGANYMKSNKKGKKQVVVGIK